MANLQLLLTTPRQARRTAPEVPLDTMVDAMELALGDEILQKACQGDNLIFGNIDDDTNKITKSTLQRNFAVLQGLLSINQGGIFRRSTLKECLVALDVKYKHKITTAHGKHWADRMANMLNNLFIALRQAKKNTTTGKRTPEWLKTLFQLLRDDDTPRPSRDTSGGSAGDAADSSRPTGPLRAGRQGLLFTGTPGSPRKRSKPLLYFAGQSPKKKLFSDKAEKEEDKETKGADTQFYYNKVRGVAVKIQNGNIETTNMYELTAKGRRQYVWPDGTVWDMVGQLGQERQEEDEDDAEEDKADESEEEDEEKDEDGAEEEDEENQDEEEEGDEDDEDQEACKKTKATKQVKSKDGKVKSKGDETNKESKKAKGKQGDNKKANGSTAGTMKAKGQQHNQKKARGLQDCQKNIKVHGGDTKKLKGQGDNNKNAKACLTVDVAYKTKLRHRMHSKKWHQVYNEALSRGVSQDKAKVRAGLLARAHVSKYFQNNS